jgi:ribosomal protein S18 acetylase RimI-like enzyme
VDSNTYHPIPKVHGRFSAYNPRVPIDAAVAAEAFVETWRYLVSAVPGGWTRAKGAGVAGVTGVAVAGLNVVWVQKVDAHVEDISDLLDEVAATGLPHCLQVRPGAVGRLAELAGMRGMAGSESTPLMATEDPGQLKAAQAVSGLVIRELVPDEAQLHAQVAAAGFEVPLKVFLQLITPEVLATPGVRCYVGEAGGQPVTTGLGVRHGSNVAIFNIATPPEYRRRGYGAAVTARAVADGLAAGAQWSCLQSSTAGYKVYERLGFRMLEAWPCWVARPEPIA